MNETSRIRLEEARVLLQQVRRVVADVRKGLDDKFDNLSHLAQQSRLAQQNTLAYNELEGVLTTIDSLDQKLVEIKNIRGR